MDATGIDPRPIKKLTGEYGFCQTYFDDARIPADCLRVRKAKVEYCNDYADFRAWGNRWPSRGIASMELNVDDVVELSRRAKRNGSQR